MEEDFYNHQKYSEVARKLQRKKIPVVNGRANALPPIENDHHSEKPN
jgi:hypothetical protein